MIAWSDETLDREQQGALPAEVELPFARVEAGERTRSFAGVTRLWDSRNFTNLTESIGVETEGAYLAAWAILLAAYSGRRELSLGLMTDTGSGALQVTVDPALEFGQFAKNMAASLMLPLSGPIPLTSVFATSASPLALSKGAELADLPTSVQFTISILDAAEHSEMIADFDVSMFEPDAVPRILDHFHEVLVGVAQAGATALVGSLGIVPESELARINTWNSTAVDWGGSLNLESQFANAVRRWPTFPAVTFGDQSLDYQEFNVVASRIAARLSKSGVGRGSMVGVLCERSVELVAALYGVVLAGAAYVPLDPEYPQDRIEYMVAETGMEVVLFQEKFGPLIAESEVVAIDLSQLLATADSPDLGLAGSITAEDVAYVIYTSGSTGRPKGVANSHGGVTNRLLWMQDRYRIGPGNVVLQKTPFSFDVSVWEFFWPLEVGARLVMAAPGGHRDPAYLIESINHHRVDTIHFVPSMLRLFLDHPAAGSCTTLRRVICSGEALTRDLQDRFFAVLPEAELHNLYGPTEAAIDVTEWQCQPDDTLPVVPIGRPIANTTIHILDQNLRPLPIGIPGELFIGGVQVALGYVNRPDLTSERFLADPYRPGGRLYKTGDLARWLPNGTVDFMGRLDHQVKIRGQRVELGEIESTLGEHPAVLEAAVMVNEVKGDVQLVAHIMWRREPASDATLRAFLGSRLPSYMIPTRFVTHESLPLTSSGKVDRNALLAQEAKSQTVVSRDSGSGSLEDWLLGIWSSVLGRSDIGPNDRVFDSGATSLQAAAFVNEVQRSLGEFIYVVTVFTAPTVTEYASFLREHYPDAIARRFDGSGTVRVDEGLRVDASLLTKMEEIIPRLGPFPQWREGPPNPQAAFILAPPRSGTTLLRVMLAGHSRIFAAPELQLLGFDTLAERREILSGPLKPWLEGTLRAVMELEGVNAESATEFVARLEDQGLSSKEFFALLQERAGGRLLIDKSPAYALDLEVLRNAETGFERPLYIQLVRDPLEMSRSFESYHMEQILFLREHSIPSRTLGELVWNVSHRNILAFAEEIDPSRLIRISFEDLVADPRPSMERLAAFLGLEFEGSLIRPYENLDRKMVDGLHAASTPMGDTRLLERGRIDPSAATRWSQAGSPSLLGEPTQSLVKLLARDSGGKSSRRRHEYAAAARSKRVRGGNDG